jgi:serine phosphatase RsbU (regulator of sigma subunit)
LAHVRINWRLKAILPVAGVLWAGLLAFLWVTVEDRNRVILVAAGGALAIVAMVLIVLAVLIQRPLIELRRKIAQVRDGDLTVTASFADYDDDLGDLGRDFNEMVRRLRENVEEHKSAEDEIRALNADLERRVDARTAELQAAMLRERAANAAVEQAREREIEIGFHIQQTLLLDPPPKDFPGLSVAALTIPSQRIDGDFYIFIRHRNQLLDVIVGDVMGKGVAAALLGAATKSYFLEALSKLMALANDGKVPEPKEIVMLAHADVVHQLIDLESFVTVCYARFDLNKGSLDVVDCGHTGIVHFHAKMKRCDILHGDNLPLGVLTGEIYEQISVAFEPGDVLFFYSDGITEARGSRGELFGVERLAECVRAYGELEPEDMVAAVRKDVSTYSGSARLDDDLTCVAVRIDRGV